MRAAFRLSYVRLIFVKYEKSKFGFSTSCLAVWLLNRKSRHRIIQSPNFISLKLCQNKVYKEAKKIIELACKFSSVHFYWSFEDQRVYFGSLFTGIINNQLKIEKTRSQIIYFFAHRKQKTVKLAHTSNNYLHVQHSLTCLNISCLPFEIRNAFQLKSSFLFIFIQAEQLKMTNSAINSS
ncbi:hypothetical protein Tsp_07788 [Trichinella spiralis]|uniref:hypothetical protein n=1 Tax=Trichinella spiralis TaxID=6334 RepID=UPI0001EFCC21|nr:hypothetical protein Tsp_07788 [Trichinella spiralis]